MATERRRRAARLLEECAAEMQQTKRRGRRTGVQSDPLELVSRVGCHKSFMVSKEHLEHMSRLAALPADLPPDASETSGRGGGPAGVSLVPVMRPNTDYTSAKITALLCREAVRDGDTAKKTLLALVDEIFLTERTFGAMLNDGEPGVDRSIPQRLADEFGSRVADALATLRHRLAEKKNDDTHLGRAVALWGRSWRTGVLPTRVEVCDMLFGLGRRIMLDAAELRIILDTLAHWALVDDKPERAVRTLMSGQPQDDNGRVSLLNTAIVLGASVVLVEPGAVIETAGGRHLPQIKITCQPGMVVSRSLWLSHACHRRRSSASGDDDPSTSADGAAAPPVRPKHKRLPDDHPYVPLLFQWAKHYLVAGPTPTSVEGQPAAVESGPVLKMPTVTLDVLKQCMWVLRQRQDAEHADRQLNDDELEALQLLESACQSPRAMSLCDWHRLVDALSQRFAISKVAVLNVFRALVKEEILYRTELDQLIMTVRNLAPGRSTVPMMAVVNAVREFVRRAAAAQRVEHEQHTSVISTRYSQMEPPPKM